MTRLFLLALPLVVAGCGAPSGAEYLGKWTREATVRRQTMMGTERVDITRDSLTIERNGDGYLLRSAHVYQQGSKPPKTYPESKTPALLKDGQLQVAGGLGAYVIDKSSGHLVAPDGDGEYVRVN